MALSLLYQHTCACYIPFSICPQGKIACAIEEGFMHLIESERLWKPLNKETPFTFVNITEQWSCFYDVLLCGISSIDLEYHKATVFNGHTMEVGCRNLFVGWCTPMSCH